MRAGCAASGICAHVGFVGVRSIVLITDPDRIIIRNILECAERDDPEREIVTFESGERWTARDTVARAWAAADALRARGIVPADVVVLFLPNGPDYLRAWWGVNFLGAELMPFNLAWRRSLFTHFITLSKPKLCVTDAGLAPILREEVAELPIVLAEELLDGDPAFRLSAPLTVGHTHHLGATSGTTGPSKLWRVSHLQFAQLATYVQSAGLGPRDRFLVDLPLFHQHAMGTMRSCLASGVPISLRTKPSLSRYFDVVRETGATALAMIGSTAARLDADPPSPSDRDHGLRLIFAAPLPRNIRQFAERFGIEKVVTGLGSTELGGPIISDPAEIPIEGSCGKGRDGWELRVVDENDIDVPEGCAGEMIAKPLHPALMSGYVDNPDANAEAWRGGWFHSGDMVRRDAAGNFYFADRMKDSIRRSGENISSYEVETEVRAHPAVKDVACVGASTDKEGGAEVKIWVVAEDGADVDFAELAQFLARRMPKFMLPRYYELIDALPVTVTSRVQKHLLRARGNGPATWDIETHRRQATAQA